MPIDQWDRLSSGPSDKPQRPCLWGKSKGLSSPYPLLAHLLDTAAASEALLGEALPRDLSAAAAAHCGVGIDEWRQAVIVLAGLHDFGKASAGFQNQDPVACPDWLSGCRDAFDAGRHDRVGGNLVWDRWDGLRSRYKAAQIVAGHHGTIPTLDQRWMRACGGAGLVDDSPPAELADARDEIWRIVTSVVGAFPDIDLPAPAASAALAVVIAADWIASASWLIACQQQTMTISGVSDPEAHFRRARDLAATHIRLSGLVAAAPRPAATPRTMLADGAAEWTPLQASIDADLSPTAAGIAVICAPTGEGKTEAALLAADRFAQGCGRNGFFFAMPTVATAEGLHARIERHVQGDTTGVSAPVRRVHSQASLYEEPSGGVPALADDNSEHGTLSEDPAAQQAAAAWMSGTRKALLAPYGVGTVDQVLLGALRAKYSPLRLLAAAAGCVIVDEVHSLDPYMRTLLCKAVEWLAALGAPVIVLSATMPRKRVVELLASYQRGAGSATTVPASAQGGYPGWTAWTPMDGYSGTSTSSRRRWSARFHTVDTPAAELTDRIASKAAEAAASGLCVLVVRSTVRAAQETYDAVVASDGTLEPGGTIDIIHSRMPQRNRRRRSEALLRRLGPDSTSRPRRMVIVATQIVEQSFDVDFDLLVTDPAPLAALLQRGGRVRRHRPPSPGESTEAVVFWPLTLDESPSYGSLIYARADLMSARAWLTAAETATSVAVAVPDDVAGLVEQADAETADSFVFDSADVEDAAEATLAQLVRIDADKALGRRWAIPAPDPEAPLADLTGTLDTETSHPGTRHQARSVLLMPIRGSGQHLRTLRGAALEAAPNRVPDRPEVREIFDEAVPVSYPNAAWAAELPRLEGGWDRTPVAGALLLDVTSGHADHGGYRLSLCSRTGLRIIRIP